MRLNFGKLDNIFVLSLTICKRFDISSEQKSQSFMYCHRALIFAYSKQFAIQKVLCLELHSKGVMLQSDLIKSGYTFCRPAQKEWI